MTPGMHGWVLWGVLGITLEVGRGLRGPERAPGFARGWGGVTVGIPRRAPAGQTHDHGRKGQPALHAVLANAVQDAGREVDVQVAQENDAAGVLGAAAV